MICQNCVLCLNKKKNDQRDECKMSRIEILNVFMKKINLSSLSPPAQVFLPMNPHRKTFNRKLITHYHFLSSVCSNSKPHASSSESFFLSFNIDIEFNYISSNHPRSIHSQCFFCFPFWKFKRVNRGMQRVKYHKLQWRKSQSRLEDKRRKLRTSRKSYLKMMRKLSLLEKWVRGKM